MIPAYLLDFVFLFVGKDLKDSLTELEQTVIPQPA